VETKTTLETQKRSSIEAGDTPDKLPNTLLNSQFLPTATISPAIVNEHILNNGNNVRTSIEDRSNNYVGSNTIGGDIQKRPEPPTVRPKGLAPANSMAAIGVRTKGPETIRTTARPSNQISVSHPQSTIIDRVPSASLENSSPLDRAALFDGTSSIGRSLSPKPPSTPPTGRSSIWIDDKGNAPVGRPSPPNAKANTLGKATTVVGKLTTPVTRATTQPSLQYNGSPTSENHNNARRAAPNVNISSRMFCIPIEQVAKLNGVPVVMEHAISYLEEKAIYDEGLLRLAGNSTDCKQLKLEYDSGVYPNLWNCQDRNTVASLLKQFVRELPRPLIAQTITLREAPDQKEGLLIIQEELGKLAPDNYIASRRLFLFLNLVAQYSEYNKMVPNNLAIVFSPTLRLRMETLVLMIQYAKEIFTL